MYKTASQVFEAIDKQGWNKMGMEKTMLTAFNSTGMYVDFFKDPGKLMCFMHLAEIFYDKTPKNACACIAEIKFEKVAKKATEELIDKWIGGRDCTIEQRDWYRGRYLATSPSGEYWMSKRLWLKQFEYKIRHKLLCKDATGDWVKVIQGFLK